MNAQQCLMYVLCACLHVCVQRVHAYGYNIHMSMYEYMAHMSMYEYMAHMSMYEYIAYVYV